MSDSQAVMHLCVFGGGPGYGRSAKRLVKQAKKSGLFSSCRYIMDFDLASLLPETLTHIRQIQSIQKNNLGFGLWFWKPDVILEAMSQTRENEITLYMDAGCSLNLKTDSSIERLNGYAQNALHNGLFAMQLWDGEFGQKDLSDNYWGFSELNNLLQVDSDALKSNQIQAGIMFIKNCDSSRQLIQNWKDIMILDNYKYLVGPKDKKYRYDQSIFSLIYKKTGLPTIPDESYFYPYWEADGRNFPIWATRINDGVDPFKFNVGDYVYRIKRKILLLKNHGKR